MPKGKKASARALLDRLARSRPDLSVDILKLSDEDLSFLAERVERERRALKAKQVVSGDLVLKP